jgi:uncharacterized protein YggU (UPF0235/DUF167 family)
LEEEGKVNRAVLNLLRKGMDRAEEAVEDLKAAC